MTTTLRRWCRRATIALAALAALAIIAPMLIATNIIYSRNFDHECSWRPPEWRMADSNCW